MKPLVLALAILAGLSAAPFGFAQGRPPAGTPRTFTGVITDDMCAVRGHAHMQMGPTDADCTRACVALHGSLYVLLSGKTIYDLSDQKLPAEFAGQKVRVTGVIDAGSKTKIRVTKIAAAK